MTVLPDWMVSQPDGLTVADYDALPEETCRHIEIVSGAILVSPSPRWEHQVVARRLANALEAAASTNLVAATDVDLRLQDVPLLNRRPDIVVFDPSLLNDATIRPPHCVLVVEVMSPGSVVTDRIDKPAEYAIAGIEHFWRVEDVAEVGRSLTVFRYRLDPMTRTYALMGIDTGTMTVTDPVKMTIDLADLC